MFSNEKHRQYAGGYQQNRGHAPKPGRPGLCGSCVFGTELLWWSAQETAVNKVGREERYKKGGQSAQHVEEKRVWKQDDLSRVPMSCVYGICEVKNPPKGQYEQHRRAQEVKSSQKVRTADSALQFTPLASSFASSSTFSITPCKLRYHGIRAIDFRGAIQFASRSAPTGSSLDRAPLAHATEKTLSITAGTVSPCSMQSAAALNASARTAAIAASRDSP
ncbi:MAG: hypothetical protein U0R19_26885 [Bryobacteraceae bacterium]